MTKHMIIVYFAFNFCKLGVSGVRYKDKRAGLLTADRQEEIEDRFVGVSLYSIRVAGAPVALSHREKLKIKRTRGCVCVACVC